MRISAHYSREEVLAALDWANLQRWPGPFVAGVVWSEAAQDGRILWSPCARTNASTHRRRCTGTTQSRRTCSTGSPRIQPRAGHQRAAVREPPAGGSNVLILARQTKETEWGGPTALPLPWPEPVRQPRRRTSDGDHLADVAPMPIDVFRIASLSA